MRSLDPAVEVVEFTPTPEQYAWTFGGAAPVARVRPGTALKLWSDDAFCGRLRSVTDLPAPPCRCRSSTRRPARSSSRAPNPGHPRPARRRPRTGARLGRLGAHPVLRGSDLHRPHGHAATPAAGTDVDLPPRLRARDGGPGPRGRAPRPAPGTHARDVGVAPAAGEVRSALVPDVFGGNMDTPELRAGTTVYLRVNVEGALFSLGDGHFRQGRGSPAAPPSRGRELPRARRAPQDAGPGVAAAGERHPLDGRRFRAAARGRLARRAGRRRRLDLRAHRARHPRRLPGALAGQRGAAGQRRRRELQRSDEGPQAARAREPPAYDGIHDRLRALVR